MNYTKNKNKNMTRKLDFRQAPNFIDPLIMSFIRPRNSRLHRVFQLPDSAKENEEEVGQVLTTLATHYHNGVWYFDLRDKEKEQDVTDILHTMGILHIFVSLDTAQSQLN